MSEKRKYSLYSSSSCNSKEFCDFDSNYKTDCSVEIEETEDIYEMALEILEADEAFRLESSGSISPESDVDRLLENADTERFSGDVTLVRIFSIRQDDACIPENDFDLRVRESWNEMRKRTLPGSQVFDSALGKSSEESKEYRHEDEEEAWTTMNDLSKVKSEPSFRIFRASSDDLSYHQAFGSDDFVSIDLNSDSRSVESDLFTGTNSTKLDADSVAECSNRDPQLIYAAKFSNVKSKDARIRTALILNSPPEKDDDPLGDGPAGSVVSLHVTSSDSLYSTTDDCFGDSAPVNLKSRLYNGAWNMYTSSDDENLHEFPVFTFREPSPEDLFDEALETRSDLAGSISSSIQLSPQCVYFDALQCSPVCVHRDPSPEDEFDLALETLSDVVDDSSSSIFIISPRRTDHQKQQTTSASEPLLSGITDSHRNQTDQDKMADGSSSNSSSIDVDFRRLYCLASPDGSSGSSCEVVPDDDPSHLGRLMGANAGESSEPLTADEFSEEAKDERINVDPWSSDCPSSPEPSFLAEYSTDDCIGESEGDESLTDYEASSGIDWTPKSNFYYRLLRRKELRETMDLWDESRVANRGGLLDNIQICSIEDLLTDSENDKDFLRVKAPEAPSPNECSPIYPLVRAKVPVFLQPSVDDEFQKKEPENHQRSAEVAISLSPPIALAVRADIQFARKSKIPKLPESRNAFAPVRISW